MPDKHKSRSKSRSAEATKGYEDIELVSGNLIRELFQSQERLLKWFIESIAANLTKRIDDLVFQVADLRASLEFSKKDISEHKAMIEMIDVKLQSTADEISMIHTVGTKQFEKVIYLENQSRRNSIRIEGVAEESGETRENTEIKVKEMLAQKLQMKTLPLIERAHRTGKGKKTDDTS